MESPLFQKSPINRSLVLAGGGVRLAYHAGVLKALEESSLKFNHVDGTSGGIFNTAMLASGLNADEIIFNWKKLNVFHFMSPTPLRNYLKLSRMNAMGDADGIRKNVFPTLGFDISKIRNNSKFHTSFNVCNFSTKEIEAISGEKITEDHLIAGMSLPIFMPSIKIGNDWYTDAVWVKDANLMEAVKHGADEIYLVYCIGNSREYLEGSFLQYVHMIEMSAAGGLLAEFDWLVEINKQILSGNSPYGQAKPIKLHVIKPTYPLPLDPDMFFGHINIISLINMGYAHTKEYLQLTENKGVNLDYKASLMKEPGVSFQFQAEFEGIIDIENNATKAIINLIFDFRKQENIPLDHFFYGSIYLEELQKHICFYNTKLENNDALILSSNFYFISTIYSFSAEIMLNNSLDFRLGFEFKLMKVTINSNKQTIFEQSIRSRLKSVLKSKIYLNGSFIKRIKAKNEILKLIF